LVLEKIRVSQNGHVESMQGSLKVGMVRIQEGSGLSATADSLNPEEIRHGCRPCPEARFPTQQYTPPPSHVKSFKSFDEGVNVPEAKPAVVIGGQASTRQAKQRLGRILRRTGNVRTVLYEVVCEATKQIERSRTRRRSDAYERTRHRHL
jgi:hypothetical protein